MSTNDRLWLDPEVQRLEIEVRLYPSFRHSGQGWEGLKVTHNGSRGSPIRDTLFRRFQSFRHLHDCSGYFRLERWPGGTRTHWKSAALPRRTPDSDIARDKERLYLKSAGRASYTSEVYRIAPGALGPHEGRCEILGADFSAASMTRRDKLLRELCAKYGFFDV